MNFLLILSIATGCLCFILLAYIWYLKKDKIGKKNSLQNDLFLDNLSLPYFYKTDLLYYNKAFKNAFGIRAKEVISELMTYPKNESSIFELTFDNGIKKSVQLFFTPLLDSDKHPIGHSGILVDVSTFLRNKQTLVLKKERMEFALDALEAGTWDWDIEKENFFFSKQSRMILGYDEDEKIIPNLSSWLNLVHPKDIASVNEALATHLNHTTSLFCIEHRIRNSEPLQWVRVQGKAFFNHAGKATRMIGTFIDITNIKNEEEMKTQENDLFHAFFEHLPSMAFIKNKTGNYLYLNTAYQQFIGFKPWHMKTAHELFDAKTAKQIGESDRLALYEGIWEHSIDFKTPMGEKETKIMYKFPIQNNQGEKLLCGFSVTINKSLY